MARILFVATIFRCGEKVYPILPALAKEHDVDILLHNEMRREFPWPGFEDPRPSFYSKCESLGMDIIKDHRSASFDGYDLVLVDDNFCKGSLGLPDISRKAKAKGIKIYGCPHGNHEFARMRRFLNLEILDGSFVFGKEEQQRMFDGKFQGKLIPGGMPDNDILKDMNPEPQHILVVPSYLPTQNSQPKNKNGYLPFTENTLIHSGILDLQQRYGLPVVIKEKTRSKKNLKKALGSLEKYEGVKVIMDHEDLNGLVAASAVVVGAPSTLCFKSIQKGIPTVLIRDYGMVGNFEYFKGLTSLDKKKIIREVERQASEGRDEVFISKVLEGGVSYSSSDIYINEINKLVGG